MKKQSRRIFVFISAVIIWVLLTAVWIATWMTSYAEAISRPFGYKGNWLVFALYAGMLFMITHMYGGYKIGYYQQTDVFFSGVVSLIFTNIISYIQICLLGAAIMPWRPVFYATLIGFLLIWIWVVCVHRLYQKFYPPYKLLMIYTGKVYAHNLINKIIRRDDKYNICETIDASKEDIDYIYKRIDEYDSVILSDLDTSLRNVILKHCYEYGIRVYLTPKLSDILVRNARAIELFDSPILLTEKQEMSVVQKAGKRTMDIVISIIGIIITSPIMIIIAIAIKSDGGPAFYNQERLTKDGKVFSMYKFRSMVVDADKIAGNRLATENDPRITPVGRFIRKIRVDELPQLFNILKGEMSMVGPRPEHPDIAAQYEKEIPEFSYRLKVKAGLTGYAQVVGKYDTTPYDKIKMDLMYITSYSLLNDIKIILQTFKIIFNVDSSKGIREGKKTASLHEDE